MLQFRQTHGPSLKSHLIVPAAPDCIGKDRVRGAADIRWPQPDLANCTLHQPRGVQGHTPPVAWKAESVSAAESHPPVSGAEPSPPCDSSTCGKASPGSETPSQGGPGKGRINAGSGRSPGHGWIRGGQHKGTPCPAAVRKPGLSPQQRTEPAPQPSEDERRACWYGKRGMAISDRVDAG